MHFSPTTVPAIWPQRNVIRQNHGYGGGGRGVRAEDGNFKNNCAAGSA